MANSLVWTITFLFLVHFSAEEASSDGECDANWSSGRALNASINSRRNLTGEWVTTFSAVRESNGTSADIHMDVNHRFTECRGKHVVHIQGVIREMNTEKRELSGAKLTFHQRCGTNVRVTNNGRSVEKINLEEWHNGVAFTNRPLRDNELFEVRLDMKHTKFKDAIGIGVTTKSPDKIDIPYHMNNMRSGNWMMYLSNVYKDGSLIKSSFMKDLKEIQVGGRVGVKRTDSGNLHLFINGIDQGIAASNVTSPVYGVFELYNDAAKVTIID